MALPAAAIAVKAAIAALSDENGRKVIGGIVVAILSPIILIIVVIISMLAATAEHNNAALKLSFEGGVISSQVPADYRQHITDMQQSFSNLESVLADIHNECEFEDGEPDMLRIKAVFYALFFGSDYPQAHADKAFVDCFLTYETRSRTWEDEDGDEHEEEYEVAIPITDLPTVYANVGALIGRPITPEDAANITEIYYRVQSGDYSSRQPDSLEGGSNGTHSHIAELTADDDTPFVGGNFSSPIDGDWQSIVSCEFGTGYPVTQRQEVMIASLLRSAPDARDMFEYEDYTASPSAKSASEFIEQALEQNADRFADRKIFLEYIANRPRVQKLGAHGLFSDDDAPINLSQVKNEVADHPGNVWTNIVSLRREDAARLGFDNASAWQALMREKRNEIAECMKIKPEHLKWYAAFHDEGSHPHIHFIAYTIGPKEAYLSAKGIDGIRSCLSGEIFRQDLLQIYSEQTLRRDTLNRESLSVMQDMCERMQNGVYDNPQVNTLLQHLSDKLSNTGGKKQYGYLKADVKEIVNSIVDELEKDPRVSACYSAWYEMRNQVLQTYADKLPDSIPLSQQKEFKQIKNMVINQAMNLIGHEFDFMPDDIAVDYTMNELPEISAQYALAKIIIDSGGDTEKIAEAVSWLEKSADSGNQFAQYTLGKLYRDGNHVEKDIAKAIELFTASAEQNNQFAQYALGKLFFLGEDVPKDPEQAVYWFELSATQGNEYAQYFLEHVNDQHNPLMINAVTGLLRGLSKLFEDQQQQQQAAQANHIDRKRVRQLREKQQSQGHAQNDHIQNYS